MNDFGMFNIMLTFIKLFMSNFALLLQLQAYEAIMLPMWTCCSRMDRNALCLSHHSNTKRFYVCMPFVRLDRHNG